MSSFGRLAAPLGRHLAAMLCLATVGCNEPSPPPRPTLAVRAVKVSLSPVAESVVLTGEVRARYQSDLAFRVAGRIDRRLVDVGEHVKRDQLLAALDTREQKADVTSATAGVQAAEASLRQANAAFDRQKTLIASGFTTQTLYDNADQALKAARATLESARANLATAKEQLSFTDLRANADGIVTARNAEAGQVVDAAQLVFTLARDGDRDAVFDVYEALVAGPPENPDVALTLVADPAVTAKGRVREIAPVVDLATGTVRVKIAIQDAPARMYLGSAVSGRGRFRARMLVALPQGAFFTQGGQPAVWIVDPQTRTVSLRSVVVDAYRTREIFIREGLAPGEIVVTAGVQLLQVGQQVDPQFDVAQAGDAK